MALRLKNWFFTSTKTALKKGTRFKNDDRPPEETFVDLLESSVFKTELEDRAKTDIGEFSASTNGHVTLATDEQVKALEAQKEDRSLVVQPHQTTTIGTSSQDFDDYEGEVFISVLDNTITSRKNFLMKFSDQFLVWLLTRLLPTGGTINQVLRKSSNDNYDVSWADDEIGLDWSENLTTSDPVIGGSGKGYTAEGGIISTLDLPNTPQPNTKIGVSADNNSGVIIRLEGSTDTYFTLVQSQSVIFRYDSSKSLWLVENSHLPEVETSSTTIYVDSFATSGGDGSILLPFNNIKEAVNYIIGSGSTISPEFTDMTIKVVAGTFNEVDLKLWVNTLTVNIEDGVIVNLNTAGTTPFYLIENTNDNITTTNFTLLGKATFVSESIYCKFINAIGTNQSATTAVVPYNTINTQFKKYDTTYSHTSAVNDIIKAECLTEENGGRLLLGIDAETITVGRTNNVITVGQGSYVDIKNVYFGVHFDINNRSTLALRITDCYQAFFTNCTIGTSAVSKHCFIEGSCDLIKFTNCIWSVTSSTNPSLQLNNCVKLSNTFASVVKLSGSSKISGLFFTKNTTSSNNFTNFTPLDYAGTSGVYGRFLFKVTDSGVETASGVSTDYDSFNVRLEDNNVDGLINGTSIVSPPSVINYSNSYLIGGVPRITFAINIVGYSVINYPKTFKYDNLPSNPTNLYPGMIYTNSGVLTIV